MKHAEIARTKDASALVNCVFNRLLAVSKTIQKGEQKMLEQIHEHLFITKFILLISISLAGIMSMVYCLPCFLARLAGITGIVTKKHYLIALISAAASVPLIMLLDRLDTCRYPPGSFLLVCTSCACIPLILAGLFMFMNIRLPDGSTVWREILRGPRKDPWQ